MRIVFLACGNSEPAEEYAPPWHCDPIDSGSVRPCRAEILCQGHVRPGRSVPGDRGIGQLPRPATGRPERLRLNGGSRRQREAWQRSGMGTPEPVPGSPLTTARSRIGPKPPPCWWCGRHYLQRSAGPSGSRRGNRPVRRSQWAGSLQEF